MAKVPHNFSAKTIISITFVSKEKLNDNSTNEFVKLMILRTNWPCVAVNNSDNNTGKDHDKNLTQSHNFMIIGVESKLLSQQDTKQ